MKITGVQVHHFEWEYGLTTGAMVYARGLDGEGSSALHPDR